jgi:hypothetical protein
VCIPDAFYLIFAAKKTFLSRFCGCLRVNIFRQNPLVTKYISKKSQERRVPEIFRKRRRSFIVSWSGSGHLQSSVDEGRKRQKGKPQPTETERDDCRVAVFLPTVMKDSSKVVGGERLPPPLLSDGKGRRETSPDYRRHVFCPLTI